MGFIGRWLCRYGRHKWEGDYREPSFIPAMPFWTNPPTDFPLATAVNESKGFFLKCSRCGIEDRPAPTEEGPR